MRTAALCTLAVALFGVGLIGLFPQSAASVLAGAGNMYTVGFSASDEGWHVLGAIGGAALVASAWVLSPVFRRSR